MSNPLENLRRRLLLQAKNLIGWKTDRKIVVFAVDDYGNVRLASKAAREVLDKKGLRVFSRFDLYDSLETADDLSALFEVLTAVRDSRGRHAVFTPLALPMNIDFERIIENGYVQFYNELLPATLAKLPAHKGAWELWKEGMRAGIFLPQYHGREHLNLKVFNHLLRKRDPELMLNLQQRCYARISSRPFPNIEYPAAFHFEEFNEQKKLQDIASEGLAAFERVFGTPASLFNAPAGREHHSLHETLARGGVRYIESALLFNEHQGSGKYRKRLRYTGKQNQFGQTFLVRNVVFEPAEDWGLDWVNFALEQIAAAFRWRRPAHISSHRVNFCGHLDEKNRATGLRALKTLLQKIVATWPEVEFMSAHELGEQICADQKKVRPHPSTGSPVRP